MIQVDLQNIRSFIPLPYEAALSPRLRIAHDHLQNGDGAGGEFTGWVRLPEDYDKAEFARIKAAAKKIQSDSQALVVIGIGGSYLGARGIIECLRSPNYNLKKKDTPNIYFVGNGLSSDYMSEIVELAAGCSPSRPAHAAGSAAARRPSENAATLAATSLKSPWRISAVGTVTVSIRLFFSRLRS